MTNRKRTALLMNLFLFPGSGHLYLKKWISGSLIALVCVLTILWGSLVFEMELIKQMNLNGGLSVLFTHASEFAKKAFINDLKAHTLWMGLLGVIWLAAALHLFACHAEASLQRGKGGCRSPESADKT
ncbi:MAG: hypothetical protein A3G32_00785 [Deltaproteobacteria bacterium RIFCSPLOWO2_12_FULL_40_28]|nr:MAG: hypothetical protein A3C45_09670 [Deltaproteobacteria bacterium RIFCSPHIGHO2_02_FULL_40_28]OGQ19875.1 MAG: hypothetical protein A3E27_06620 [Deltaproteobacteria bacterium RIFCSPHIGHO2_12_FULL_40_32]OGQ39634.1 MAG: hypothetical protein A3I69_06050 [Deltaproteobacteria bacterium RIFCSPLOWO2_02_FULL_40_36]OGQ52890.1 MAG: hypothetical protein A3G32_00785 [Deltaproteobacteria bacterium RIFCSPLOWO2_12_FULL_40_28]